MTECCENHAPDHVRDMTELDHETDEKAVVIDPGETKIPVHDGIEVEVDGAKLDCAEIDAYVAYAKRKEGTALRKLIIHVEGDEVNLEYRLRQEGFERVRRITGYLVGTVDRWNSAKQHELHDRRTHGLAHEATIGHI